MTELAKRANINRSTLYDTEKPNYKGRAKFKVAYAKSMIERDKIDDLFANAPMSREEHEQSVREYQKAIDTQASILQRRGLWIQRLISIVFFLLLVMIFTILY